MFFTYILYSFSRDRYYIGSTCNLEKRLAKHNTSHKGFTGRAGDCIVVNVEEFVTREQSQAREKQIKSLKSRKMIERLLVRAGS